MATTTTNLQLTKPDANDPIKDFREPYNENLSKIDTFAGNAAVVKSRVLLTSGQSITFQPDAEITLVVGQYGSNCFEYMLYKASATNVAVAAVKDLAGITVSSSSGTVTFSNTTGNTYRCRFVNL